MKKQILFLVMIIVVMGVVSGCQKNMTVTGGANISTTSDAIVDVEKTSPSEELKWLKYRDEQLKFEFEYPAECYIEKSNEQHGFDQGKKQVVGVKCADNNPINFSFYSSDYKEGVSEGCCTVFSNSPIDLKKSLNELKNDIKDFNPVVVKKVKIGNTDALRYFSVGSYDWFWVTDNIILPYDDREYANLIIGSSVLNITYVENSAQNEKEGVMEALISKVEENNFIEDEYRNDYLIFEKILSTIKFQ